MYRDHRQGEFHVFVSAVAPRFFALLAALWLVFSAVSPTIGKPQDEKADQDRRTAERKARIAERNALRAEAISLRKVGKLAEAVAAAEKAAETERALSDEPSLKLAELKEWTADVQEEREQFEAAEELRREVLAIKTKLLGKGHWQVTDARLAAENAAFLRRLLAAERLRLRQADELNQRAVSLWQAGKSREAIAPVQNALMIRRDVLGQDQPLTAVSLNNLATLYLAVGDYAKAEPLYQKALAIRKKVLGDEHPETAASLNNLGRLCNSLGDFAQAEPLYQKALEIREKVFGDEHPETATSLINLAELYRAIGDYAKAEPLLQKALESYKKVLGEEHPHTATALNNLGVLYHAMGNYAKSEPLYRKALEIRKKVLGDEHTDTATSLNNLGALFSDKGDYARARPLFQEALETTKKVHGDEHRDTGVSLNNLAALCRAMGDYAQAEPLFQKALEISKKTHGDEHASTASRLNNLGALYVDIGDYAQAERHYRKALAIRKKVLGDEHGHTATSLRNLGALYNRMGDYSRAEPLFQIALKIDKRIHGDEHHETALSLHLLGSLYDNMRDYARAEPLYQKALEINKKVLGEEHPQTAVSLNNLATLYHAMHDYAKAEPLYQKALVIRTKVLGKEHPHTVANLSGLAMLSYAKGDYAEAERMFQKSIEISRKVLGEEHPTTAASIKQLGLLYCHMGEYAQAEPLLQKALAIRKKLLGDKHPNTAASLAGLAHLYQTMGDDVRSVSLLRQRLEVQWTHMEWTFGAQSERQKMRSLAELRWALDEFLSLAHRADVTAQESYVHALTWKGIVLSRRHIAAGLRHDPDAARLFHELQSVSGRLATLAFAVPGPEQRDVWLKHIEKLSEDREQLEVELSRRSAEFRQRKKAILLTPRVVQEAMPAETVLVDFLAYYHHTPPGFWQRVTTTFRNGARRAAFWLGGTAAARVVDRVIHGRQDGFNFERRLLAFFIPTNGEVHSIDLGPIAPIEKAIDAWRKQVEAKRYPEAELAADLRERLWKPLEPFLNDAETVLISPDGPLCKFPFSALPGQKPGTYLLEEKVVAVVPVPQLLPQLLAEKPPVEERGEPSLLVIGDVDYGKSPGASDGASDDLAKLDRSAGLSRAAAGTTREGRLLNWKPLLGTRGEMNNVADSFELAFSNGAVKKLRRDGATESAFRQQAPKHRFLHLATHGFFAPPEIKSALALRDDERSPLGFFDRQEITGWHPGLLSGLVLTGANTPPKEGEDDGILTALEVAALDLRGVDLAVLSACQSGLGKTAGGEGLLGLQRAFQVAGARTTVATLWKVDDLASGEIMARFYEKFWDATVDKRFSKLEALRQAQLWMLRNGASDEGEARGLTPGWKPQAKGDRPPPYFWAAFVLSGDWR